MDKEERTRCCTNFLVETLVRWFERSLLIELTTMKRRAASARWYLAARLGSSPAIVERKSRIGGVGLDQSSRYAPPTESAVLLCGVSCVGVETGAASSFLPYPSVWFDIMTPVNHLYSQSTQPPTSHSSIPSNNNNNNNANNAYVHLFGI